MPLRFAADATSALPLRLVETQALDAVLNDLSDSEATWARAQGFSAKLGEVVALPGADGRPTGALVGWGDAKARARDRFHLAGARELLPRGTWRIESGLSGDEMDAEALGWLLQGYRFDRYRGSDPSARELAAPEGLDAPRMEAIAAGVALARDLVNTPACDMGPVALEAATRALAAEFGAEISVVEGDALPRANLPLIHAVGRAAEEAPRLIRLGWGRPDAPRVSLVGKGVCFDTGGLDVKPPASMRLMKKDMGGAATVLGLARMVMALQLNLRLDVLIPAVENAIGPASFRPGDILRARNGLTVEIGNTDAEGRLVLADALSLASEDEPELLIDFATLTGAARVALGPELPPLYCDDDTLAADIAAASRRARDPLWRMPLWAGYESDISSPIADLDNAPAGGFAGSITAALFLKRFVAKPENWAHFDIYGWTPKARPGRPLGGEMQAGRAILSLLEARYG